MSASRRRDCGRDQQGADHAQEARHRFLSKGGRLLSRGGRHLVGRRRSGGAQLLRSAGGGLGTTPAFAIRARGHGRRGAKTSEDQSALPLKVEKGCDGVASFGALL